MDEEKDLEANDQDKVDSSDTSDNSDVPLDEQNPSDVDSSDGSSNKAGNGYGTLAANNRQAFQNGLVENYNDRIARNQAMLNEARREANNPHKMKKGHEGEDEKTDEETGESNFEEKSRKDKLKDKANALRAHAGVLSEKANKVRSGIFAVTNPGEASKMAAEAAAKALTKKLLIAIGGFIAAHAGILFLIALGAMIIIGMDDSNSSGIANANSGECGFTISATSLSKDEYITKIVEFAKKDSRAKIFAENAGNLYDLSVASNVNPELVMVRAHVEGYSPGSIKNNYWGMGCTNEGGFSACITYSSFLNGARAFINNASKYSSLPQMMGRYANIGPKWLKGDSSYGGCYYFEHMEKYYANTPEAQKARQRAKAACDAGGTGIPTNDYDQEAYATWQIKRNMSNARESIFGLEFEEGVVCSDNSVEGNGLTTGNMVHPCPGLTRVSSEFGPRKSPGGIGSTNHKGIDLAAPTGTPVYAVDGGTVIISTYSSSAGNYVAVEHDNNFITQYMHLDKRMVSVDQKVSKNQVIGKVGNTGNSTGPHLHFGIIVNGNINSPKYENPRKYINF